MFTAARHAGLQVLGGIEGEALRAGKPAAIAAGTRAAILAQAGGLLLADDGGITTAEELAALVEAFAAARRGAEQEGGGA